MERFLDVNNGENPEPHYAIINASYNIIQKFFKWIKPKQ